MPVGQIELEKYNAKTWWRSALLGFFLGLAIIVPGVSGATIALIFAMYESLIYAIGNLFKDFKKCFRYLLPIGIGAVVGVAVGFVGVQRLFLTFPFVLVCLFGGLMAGATPAILDNLKGAKLKAFDIILLIVGVIIPITIAVVALFWNPVQNSQPLTFGVVRMIAYLVLGFVISLTQIVPGLSATALLMAVGEFGRMLTSLHVSYLIENPLVILLFISCAIGFFIGLILISKGISELIAKNKVRCFALISGLSIGSIISMFLSADIVNEYKVWSMGVSPLQIIIAVLLFIVGFLLSLALVKLELKKHQKTNNIEKN